MDVTLFDTTPPRRASRCNAVSIHAGLRRACRLTTRRAVNGRRCVLLSGFFTESARTPNVVSGDGTKRRLMPAAHLVSLRSAALSGRLSPQGPVLARRSAITDWRRAVSQEPRIGAGGPTWQRPVLGAGAKRRTDGKSRGIGPGINLDATERLAARVWRLAPVLVIRAGRMRSVGSRFFVVGARLVLGACSQVRSTPTLVRRPVTRREASGARGRPSALSLRDNVRYLPRAPVRIPQNRPPPIREHNPAARL